MYRTFNGMTWPAPCEEMNELSWRLIHGKGEITRQDRLYASSIIDAYMQMIRDPACKRKIVVAELRHGPNLPKPDAVKP